MQAASDLLPPHSGAEVRAQQAPEQGKNAHRSSMCVVPGVHVKSLPWQESWVHHTALYLCLPTHFLHGNLCTPVGKQRGAHETSSSLDMSLSTLTYRAQQTSSEQRGIHSDLVAALLQPSHAH